MTIKAFCRSHGACADGAKWALSCGASTMDELWARDDVRPAWRVWIATRPGVLNDLETRLFACWCVRQVWHMLTDERSRNAIETAERFARGEASAGELAAASDAAWSAASDIDSDADSDAAWSAAFTAACAASDAARDAAWAARDAAWAASSAWAAGSARDASAATNDQARWLRENARPIFGKSAERDGGGDA